jgi:hypothetical protein
MMRRLFYSVFIITLAACAAKDNQPVATDKKDTLTVQDIINKDKGLAAKKLKTYANQTFKDVTAERVDDNHFVVQGLGQISEPSFNWAIEDGHHQLKKGVATTDEGAPEWGNFSFTIDLKKTAVNSSIHLILFEGSVTGDHRKNELIIPL